MVTMAPAKTELIFVIRCTGLRKNGTICQHVVVKLPLRLWESSIADDVEVECGSCHKIERLGAWR